jgi:hypothetical protein
VAGVAVALVGQVWLLSASPVTLAGASTQGPAVHARPVIGATATTFTPPAGSTAQWELSLWNWGASPHQLLGRTTSVGSGELTLPTPSVSGCYFQADVLTGPPGAKLTFPQDFYSGAQATFFSCGPPTCQGDGIVSNFNGTAIPGGDYIWFNSVFKASGVGSGGGTVGFSNSSISFSADGTNYTVPIPDGHITFSPSTTTGTTAFDGSAWGTAVPSGFGDNVFLAGAAFRVPPGGLPGGISPVTWTGDFTLSSVSSVHWQWGAAVYTQFSTNYDSLGIKPLHSTSLDAYHSGDQAGTPENFKTFVTGGARGGGGANATGSYSPTGSCP